MTNKIEMRVAKTEYEVGAGKGHTIATFRSKADAEEYVKFQEHGENKYEEGSRMWAIEQAFREKEVRQKQWENKNARVKWEVFSGFQFLKDKTSTWNTYTWGGYGGEDGWELYKEPKGETKDDFLAITSKGV